VLHSYHVKIEHLIHVINQDRMKNLKKNSFFERKLNKKKDLLDIDGVLFE
jgi:hypothetical protein